MIKLSKLKRALGSEVSIDFGSTSFTTAIEQKYKEIVKILGIDDKVELFNCVIKDIVKPSLKVIDYFGGDFIGLIPRIPYFWEENIIDKNKYKDNFGVVWEKRGIYYEKIFYPLKNIDIDNFKKIVYEEELNNDILKNLEKEAKELKENSKKYIVFSYPPMSGLLSSAFNLRGMEELFIDMYVNKVFYQKLLNCLLEIFKSFYSKCLEKIGKYIDIIVFKDDLGTQYSEMVSPDIYNNCIGLYHKDLFNSIKEKSDALILYHSCGSIFNLIPSLIDSGVQSLNPIQTSASNMDLFNLEKNFGRDLIFWGGIDEQKLLLSNDLKCIEIEVNKILNYFEQKGGYVFCASHVLQKDIPLKNIMKIYSMAKEFKNKTNENI